MNVDHLQAVKTVLSAEQIRVQAEHHHPADIADYAEALSRAGLLTDPKMKARIHRWIREALHCFQQEDGSGVQLALTYLLGEPMHPLFHFEARAKEFEWVTGMLRPGKSQPMYGGVTDKEREEAWAKWSKENPELSPMHRQVTPTPTMNP